MLRYDVTTNDWVIFAPSRALRPDEHQQNGARHQPIPSTVATCPFCPGNEDSTPPEIRAVRNGSSPNSPGWQVRVIPNKFPALRIEEQRKRNQQGRLFRQMGSCGAHEVIIDSPHHSLPLALQPVEQITLILRTMHDRYNDLMRDTRFQAIVIFKNHGEAAGTSLEHPHSQLIATPVAPRVLRHKLAIATDYFDKTGDCLYCTMLSEELAAEERILAVNDQHIAFLPYASHLPFETWIFPNHRQSSFRWADPATLAPLARLLKIVLLRLHVGLGNPDFNLVINTAPRGEEDSECFLWHLQIQPRLTTAAGFEMGSGMAINTVIPEDAARYLREVDIARFEQVSELV